MPGIITSPSAATVAGPEPEMAAKKHETMTHTMARPPLVWPTQASASRMSFLEICAFSMMLPARMKNGMASKTNLLVAAANSCGRPLMIVTIGRPAPCTSIAATLETPRQMAIGAPRIRSSAKRMKRTEAVIKAVPPFVQTLPALCTLRWPPARSGWSERPRRRG